jgi:hypothetical protein
MSSGGSSARQYGFFCFLVGVWLSIGAQQGAEAAIRAELEGPADGQEVAGVGIIRGWAFSDTVGVQITQVTLLVDGTVVTPIPCCSARGDVAAAFPQFPAANTLNSGFGLTQNYSLNTPGPHTIGVEIRDSSSAQYILTHTVTVVKPGGFEFLDLVDLSAASVSQQGQDIVLSGVRIRDKISQRALLTTARLRWFRNLQGLGLVEAITLGAASSEGTNREAVRAAQTSAASALRAVLESPANGQSVSGIAVIRGWAFSAPKRSIRRMQLLIDGAPFFTIPCCSARGDVAAAFPSEPNARNSGFGITFNYGLLPAGVHTIAVEIEDSAGDSRTLTKGVLVKRPGAFEFLDQLDLSSATVRLAGGALVVEGARAQDRITQQVATRILRYRFDVSAQAFNLVEESVDEVRITNLTCTTNGDTSSISALKSNPGTDGISLPEAIQAINNTASGAGVFVPWSNPGTILCPNPLPTMTRGNVTIDGDVDGNGTPDVTLDGSGASGSTSNPPTNGLVESSSEVTIHGLAVRNFSGDAVRVVASRGTTILNVAILGLDVTPQSEGNGIVVQAQTDAGQETRLSGVLMSGNQISGGVAGINIEATGTSSTPEGLTLRNMTVTGNTMTKARLVVAPNYAEGAKLTQITIANNTVSGVVSPSILVHGGFNVSRNNLVEALVADNVVTDSGQEAIRVSGSIGSVIMAEIRRNEVRNGRISYPSIGLDGGCCSARDNVIEATVADNVVSASGGGISLTGGFYGASDNTVMAQIRGNEMQGINSSGIVLLGGVEASRNTVNGTVTDNMSIDAGGGITMEGGLNASSDNNMVMGEIRGNRVQDSGYSGIYLRGGRRSSRNRVDGIVEGNTVTNATVGIVLEAAFGSLDSSSSVSNFVDGVVARNVVTDTVYEGITLSGGFVNVSDNVVRGEIRENMVQRTSAGPGIFLVGGWSASGNKVSAMVANNTVTGAREGISVYGGTTQPQSQENNQGPARNNEVSGTILRNMAQGNRGTDIAVLGGLDNSRGEVLGNLARQDIISNTANSIRCENGITGNRAECAFSGNAAISDQEMAQETNSQQEEEHGEAVPTLAATLPLLERLTLQAEELRNRAQTETDARIQTKLLRIADRLDTMKDRMAARTARVGN